ncbi:MAG: helix-turn-helix domain-containing protein [Infirmifilum sp.]
MILRKGLSIRDIAREVGRSKSYVHKVLKKYMLQQ